MIATKIISNSIFLLYICNMIEQLILSGFLGDGSLRPNGSVYFSNKYEDYIKFKKSIVRDTEASEVSCRLNKGYKEGNIYVLHLRTSEEGKMIAKDPFKYLHLLDELGLAMWMYDDGSLHKKNFFFNINSHAFTKEEQETHLIPLLARFGINAVMTSETKKDGRKFYYMRVSRHQGVYKISKILKKYFIESYAYKILPDEQMEKLSILEENYKGYEIGVHTLSNILRDFDLDDFEHKIKTCLFETRPNFLSPSSNPRLYSSNTVII